MNIEDYVINPINKEKKDILKNIADTTAESNFSKFIIDPTKQKKTDLLPGFAAKHKANMQNLQQLPSPATTFKDVPKTIVNGFRGTVDNVSSGMLEGLTGGRLKAPEPAKPTVWNYFVRDFTKGVASIPGAFIEGLNNFADKFGTAMASGDIAKAQQHIVANNVDMTNTLIKRWQVEKDPAKKEKLKQTTLDLQRSNGELLKQLDATIPSNKDLIASSIQAAGDAVFLMAPGVGEVAKLPLAGRLLLTTARLPIAMGLQEMGNYLEKSPTPTVLGSTARFALGAGEGILFNKAMTGGFAQKTLQSAGLMGVIGTGKAAIAGQRGQQLLSTAAVSTAMGLIMPYLFGARPGDAKTPFFSPDETKAMEITKSIFTMPGDVKMAYTNLGLTPDASPDQVEEAYKTLAHKWHPDVAGGDEATFKRINDQHQLIVDYNSTIGSYIKNIKTRLGESMGEFFGSPRKLVGASLSQELSVSTVENEKMHLDQGFSKEQLFKPDGSLSKEMAEAEVRDIAGKFEQFSPGKGYGDAFTYSIDSNNVKSSQEILDKANEFLNSKILPGIDLTKGVRKGVSSEDKGVSPQDTETDKKQFTLFEPASPDNLASLEKNLGDQNNKGFFKSIIEDAKNSPSGFSVINDTEGKQIGVVNVEEGDKNGLTANMAIVPADENAGVATAAVNQIFGDNPSINTVTGVAAPADHPFYENLGANFVDSNTYQISKDDFYQTAIANGSLQPTPISFEGMKTLSTNGVSPDTIAIMTGEKNPIALSVISNVVKGISKPLKPATRTAVLGNAQIQIARDNLNVTENSAPDEILDHYVNKTTSALTLKNSTVANQLTNSFNLLTGLDVQAPATASTQTEQVKKVVEEAPKTITKEKQILKAGTIVSYKGQLYTVLQTWANSEGIGYSRIQNNETKETITVKDSELQVVKTPVKENKGKEKAAAEKVTTPELQGFKEIYTQYKKTEIPGGLKTRTGVTTTSNQKTVTPEGFIKEFKKRFDIKGPAEFTLTNGKLIPTGYPGAKIVPKAVGLSDENLAFLGEGGKITFEDNKVIFKPVDKPEMTVDLEEKAPAPSKVNASELPTQVQESKAPTAKAIPAEKTVTSKKPTIEEKAKIKIQKAKQANVFKEIAQFLNPTSFAHPAAMDVIMKHKGTMEQQQFRIERETKNIRKMWDRQPDAVKLDFIGKVEEGKQVPEEFTDIAKMYRERLDNVYKAIVEFKNMNFIKDFFPHFWKDPTAIENDFLPGVSGKRPLQGTKSFLKQRVFATIKEGYDAGYKLKSTNPEELMQYYEQNARKFIMAQNIKQDLIAKGFWKFVRQGDTAPADFARIDDNIARVYFPPEVKVTEYFDKDVMNKLEKVALDLGITHERLAKSKHLTGSRLGVSLVGQNEIQTKMATPEDVIIHELGHQIDEKFGLQNTFLNDPALTKELRALADLRYAGEEEVSNYFKSYVRQNEEKMAVMFQAWLHAPEAFKQVAPHTFVAFEDFLASKPELKPILDIKPSLVYGSKEATIKLPASPKVGEYWAQKDVARLINNYLSKDLLMDTKLGQGLLSVKNTLNVFQLGLSAFHITMESLDTVVTKFSIGVSKILNARNIGDIGSGLKSGLSALYTPVSYFNAGRKFYNGSPELMAIENDLFTGGASLKTKQYYKNSVLESFMQNMREKKYLWALLRLPRAAIEASVRPMFNYYIPRLKVGAFRDLFASELKNYSKQIESGEITREKIARSVWNNIENREGEINYDNLFWNRSMKTAMMLTFRAVGWNLGTLRELGGAAMVDYPKEFAGIFKGKRPYFTPKMSYFLSLFLVVGALGAVYQYLHTGKKPKEIKDYFYPQNGVTLPNGESARVEFPSYLKDIYQYTNAPIRTIGNKLAPEFSAAVDLLNNKDFYGNYIRNQDDNLPTQAKQVATFLINQFQPFTIQQMSTYNKAGATTEQKAEGFMGIIKAPSNVTESQWDKMVTEAYRQAQGGPRPQTPEQQDVAALKSQARAELKQGKHDALDKLKKMKVFANQASLTKFIKSAKLTASERMFKTLSKAEKKKLLEQYVIEQ